MAAHREKDIQKSVFTYGRVGGRDQCTHLIQEGAAYYMCCYLQHSLIMNSYKFELS